MHPYIPHLLADIKAAHRREDARGEIPTYASIEEELEEIERWVAGPEPEHTFGYYCGLSVPGEWQINNVASAIRAKLSEETAQQCAVPAIDDTVPADLFITLPCGGYISSVSGSSNTVDEAKEKIKKTLLAFDYENQL